MEWYSRSRWKNSWCPLGGRGELEYVRILAPFFEDLLSTVMRQWRFLGSDVQRRSPRPLEPRQEQLRMGVKANGKTRSTKPIR